MELETLIILIIIIIVLLIFLHNCKKIRNRKYINSIINNIKIDNTVQDLNKPNVLLDNPILNSIPINTLPNILPNNNVQFYKVCK